MDELDARLRAMAKREHLTLPTAYETTMDSLEEQVRQGTLARIGKRRLGRRVLLLAAALAVLACGFAVASEHMGWLSPVVEEDGNGDLMAAYSIQVNQTVEGNHCDLTLENAITDGRVIYCLVTARYDETFPDIDDVMEDTILMAGSWADVVSCWRVDQGEEPSTARFILATGQVSENATENREESYLGREVELVVKMLNDRDTGVMHTIEIFAFQVRMNDTIPSREGSWPDGTQAVVTPLRAGITFTTEVDAWPAFADAGAYEDWNEHVLTELNPTFRFADGETFGPEDVLMEEIQRGTYGPRLSFTDLGDPTDPDSTRQIRCHLSLLSPRLLDPDTVTGLELDGEWYEFPAE